MVIQKIDTQIVSFLKYMVKNSNDILNNKNEIKIGSDGRFIYDKFPEKEYKLIKVNFATGDQFTKIAFLRSKDGTGTVTPEQVKKFYDEAEEEALEWWKSHPGEPVTIRVLEGEDGKQKQVIEVVPKNDLVCSNGFRTRIYDQNGKQIVGEENIRKKIKRRRAEWNQWKKEGKLEVVDHQVHHTDDGNTVSVRTTLPPVKTLHPNEINDETKWAPLVGLEGKRIENGREDQQKSSQESQQTDENKISKESNKKEGIQKENVENTSIIGKIKKNMNEWSVKKLDFILSNGTKGSQDCLVHSSAKVNISELGTLIYPVEIFTESERRELSEVLNNSSLLVNFISSGKVGQLGLNKNNYRNISLSNSSTSDNNAQQTDKGKSFLIVFGVAFVLLVAGLAIVKSRFSKKKK